MTDKSSDKSVVADQTEAFDVLIIGGGPAGYQAAIRAAQFDMNVALVESRKTLGGTCLNVGCIPSKHLLHVSHQYSIAQHNWEQWGLSAKNLTFDLEKLMKAKDKVVADLTRGIDGLIKKNAIIRIVGSASLTTNGQVMVRSGSKQRYLSAQRIVLATGSQTVSLPGIDIDEKSIVSSTGALCLDKLPEHILVIGAGVIGLELGSVWQGFGSRITVVESLPRILPGVDLATAKSMQKILQRQGMTFVLGRKVLEVTKKRSHLEVRLSPKNDSGKSADMGEKPDSSDILKPDIVLVAVGRKAATSNLGLKEAGIQVDERGFITVSDDWQTSRPGTFAVGDCIGGPMLAHKAGDEAISLIESWHGRVSNLHYSMVPSIIYTTPECATVGMGEDELKKQERPFRKGTFPFAANSRARITGDYAGQVTLLAEESGGRILGAQIVGPEAGNMIHECVLAMEFGARAEDIALTCHGHPTYNEAIREAALNLLDGAIHI